MALWLWNITTFNRKLIQLNGSFPIAMLVCWRVLELLSLLWLRCAPLRCHIRLILHLGHHPELKLASSKLSINLPDFDDLPQQVLMFHMRRFFIAPLWYFPGPWSPGPEGFACGPCIGSRRSYPNPRPATASSAASASGSSHGWFFETTTDRIVHKRNPGWWFIYGLYMVDIYIYYIIYIYIL